jgi:hypothetical protein
LNTELILIINVNANNRNISFDVVNRRKTKDYSDRNAATVWEILKNIYETISFPFMVKLEKQSRGLPIKIGRDPEVWIEYYISVLDRYHLVISIPSDRLVIESNDIIVA